MEEIGERLKQLLSEVDMNTVAFAEKVGIQRSSLSHLFSGRNKPSIDLLLKIKRQFPETDLEWLITGEKIKEPLKDLEKESVASLKEPENRVTNVTHEGVSPGNQGIKNDELKKEESDRKIKEIERVMLFYTDGSFKEYRND
jgi:transcriptional regulator with XRE-family HTH domain